MQAFLSILRKEKTSTLHANVFNIIGEHFLGKRSVLLEGIEKIIPKVTIMCNYANKLYTFLLSNFISICMQHNYAHSFTFVLSLQESE